MKRALLLAAMLTLPAFAHAAEATESVAFSVAPLRDETRLVGSLMRLANRLEEAVGVARVEVRLAKRDVVVHFDPEATGVPSLVTAVESLGFRATTSSGLASAE